MSIKSCFSNWLSLYPPKISFESIFIHPRFHHADFFYILINYKVILKKWRTPQTFCKMYVLGNLPLNLSLHHLQHQIKSNRASSCLLYQNTPVSLVMIAAHNFDSSDLTTQVLELPLLEQVVIAVKHGNWTALSHTIWWGLRLWAEAKTWSNGYFKIRTWVTVGPVARTQTITRGSLVL